MNWYDVGGLVQLSVRYTADNEQYAKHLCRW